MMSFFRKLMRNQSGNTLIITAAAMPMLIGSAGLATDTIQWALWKRQLQKAADSAAIAGVYAKMADQNVTTAVNYDAGYGTQPAAGPNNNRTGYNLLAAPVVDSSAPVPTGCTGCSAAVSVSMQIQQTLPFSSMFMTATPIITATATAAAVQTGTYCVISLENTNVTGITAGGNTSVDFGCGMITNSTSLDAAVAFGSSSVKASPVAAVGGLDTTDNWASGTQLLPYTLKQQDPFKDVAAPAIPSPCATFNDGPQSDQTLPTATYGGTPITQCYTSLNVQGKLRLQPGTYIITGDVSFGSKADVTCDGCTIVLTNANPANTGRLDINASAKLNMKASYGGDYSGILFYQNRGASITNQASKVNGNSGSFFEGAFYFPSTQVTYNGDSSITYNCVQIVSRRVTFTGNSKLQNNCPSGRDTTKFTGKHVRLVA